MIRKFLIVAFVFGLSLLSASRPAGAFTEAGEAYVYPTFPELTQTTILLGGMDITDTRVLDEYIKLMYCDLYRENYKNDFAWHTIERQISSRVSTKKEYFRSLFQVGGVVEFGQYDFSLQQFPLKDKTSFKNVGYMSLFGDQDFTPFCIITNPVTGQQTASGDGAVFSKDINIVLSEPFTFTGLKATPVEAQKILDLMEKMGNKDRKMYIRFRFRVQSVAKMKKDEKRGNYSQTDLSGEIISIDLFYDKEMTKWLTSVPLR